MHNRYDFTEVHVLLAVLWGSAILIGAYLKFLDSKEREDEWKK